MHTIQKRHSNFHVKIRKIERGIADMPRVLVNTRVKDHFLVTSLDG